MVRGLILAINFAPVPNETTVVVGLGAVAIVAGIAFFLRQRSAEVPLYDLEDRGATNVLGRGDRGHHRVRLADGSHVRRAAVPAERARATRASRPGVAILPAARVHGAHRAAIGQVRRSERCPIHVAHAATSSAFSASSRCCVLWTDHSPYWQVGLGYAFIGAGVGFAGTPASRSLTGSVPVSRAGMASGTADLQRDLGGAIMQSIMGALLTAGYAAAVRDRDRGLVGPEVRSPTTCRRELTKSFASASATAQHYPRYTEPDHRARQSQSFVDGQDWAYLAGCIADRPRCGDRLLPVPEARGRVGSRSLPGYHRIDSASVRASPRQPGGSSLSGSSSILLVAPVQAMPCRGRR